MGAPVSAQPEAPQLSFRPADPNIIYDLAIKDGTVVDPSQALHAPRDIAIKNGQIAALVLRGTPLRSTQTIDAAGTIVTPGLVDLHCHYYHQVSGIGLPADEMMQGLHGHKPPQAIVFRMSAN